MKVTKEMIEKIKNAADELKWDYEKVCVRVQDVPFELGQMEHKSEAWDDGEPTGDILPGVCTLSIEYLDNVSIYYGSHLAIVCGNEYEYGEDVGEIILRDATVCEIIS